MKYKFAIILFFWLVAYSCQKPFEKNTGSIKGMVLDQEDNPVSDAVITLSPSLAKYRTNSSGLYEFNNLLPDVYIVYAEKNGYTFIEDSSFYVEVNYLDLYNGGNNAIGIPIIGRDVELDINLLSDFVFPRVSTFNIQNSDIHWNSMGGTYVIAKGNISYIGEGITAYGHCWDIHPNPTVDDYITNLGATNNVGDFTSVLEQGLYNYVEWTPFYVRAYATNKYGTVYGEEVSFEEP